jgi:predicted secreted protein
MSSDRRIDWSYVFICILVFIIFSGIVALITISKVKEHYSKNDNVLLQVVDKIKGLHPAVDNVSFQRADKSYTINKSKIHLCIYDENGEPYPINMLTYVLIHELAHVITKSIGHTDEFNHNFEILLEKAEKEGRYDSSIPLIQNYCGHK